MVNGGPAGPPFCCSSVYASNIDYHVNGEVISLDYGNGFTLDHEFDVRKMLRRIEVKNGAAVPVDLEYGRDDNGRIISVNDRSSLNAPYLLAVTPLLAGARGLTHSATQNLLM